MMIKAIDTYHNGNYFRSRLEARWAVCFELFNIRYEYELEGFELENGNKYLPDFYLPATNSYAEVKPEFQFAQKRKNEQLNPKDISLHEDYNSKWLPFSKDKNLIIIVGVPGKFFHWKLETENFEYQTIKSIAPVMVGAKELHQIWLKPEIAEAANKTRFEHKQK